MWRCCGIRAEVLQARASSHAELVKAKLSLLKASGAKTCGNTEGEGGFKLYPGAVL